jgi:hypothetical protein
MKKFDLKDHIRKKKNRLDEELSPSARKNVMDELEEKIRGVMDQCLMDHGVERQGLSKQQAALMYRKLCRTLEDVLDDFTTTTIRDPKIKDRINRGL